MSWARLRRRGRFAAGSMTAVVAGSLLILVVLVLAGCGSSGASGSGSPETTSDATLAPDFSGTTLDGLDVSLSEYRGKPLVLAFMASW